MADGFWQDKELLGSGREADLPCYFCFLSIFRCQWCSRRITKGYLASIQPTFIDYLYKKIFSLHVV